MVSRLKRIFGLGGFAGFLLLAIGHISWLNDAAQTVQFALTATGNSAVASVWNDLFVLHANAWITGLGFLLLVWVIVRPRSEQQKENSYSDYKERHYGLTIQSARWYCTAFPENFEDITDRLQRQAIGKHSLRIRAHQDAGWGDVCARHGGQGHHKGLDVEFCYRGSVSIPYDKEQVIPPQLGLGATDSTPATMPSAYRLPLLIIKFNDAPTGPNWKVAENGAAHFSQPSDALGDGYLQLDVPGRFAMDRLITEPGASLTNKLEFKAKFPSKAAIYAGVRLRDAAGNRVLSPEDEGIFWITYQIGDPALVPTPDERYANEKVVWISGPTIGNGWVLCVRDLQKDVSAAYPGLFFSSLDRIRFRGNRNMLSVSPIICYRD